MQKIDDVLIIRLHLLIRLISGGGGSSLVFLFEITRFAFGIDNLRPIKRRNREMEKRKVTVLSYFVRLPMSADKNLYTDITGVLYLKAWTVVTSDGKQVGMAPALASRKEEEISADIEETLMSIQFSVARLGCFLSELKNSGCDLHENRKQQYLNVYRMLSTILPHIPISYRYRFSLDASARQRSRSLSMESSNSASSACSFFFHV